MSNEGYPRLLDDVDFEPMDDGFVVHRRADDRVHYLNSTATLIMAMCDGTNSVSDIAARLRVEYQLDEDPLMDVQNVLSQLRDEGLLDRNHQQG